MQQVKIIYKEQPKSGDYLVKEKKALKNSRYAELLQALAVRQLSIAEIREFKSLTVQYKLNTVK